MHDDRGLKGIGWEAEKLRDIPLLLQHTFLGPSLSSVPWGTGLLLLRLFLALGS